MAGSNRNEILYTLTPQKVGEDRWARFLERVKTDNSSTRQALHQAIDWYTNRPAEARQDNPS